MYRTFSRKYFNYNHKFTKYYNNLKLDPPFTSVILTNIYLKIIENKPNKMNKSDILSTADNKTTDSPHHSLKSFGQQIEQIISLDEEVDMLKK